MKNGNVKNNSAVDDIFKNDNSNKNRTKTILLLAIVAIILISVFLIIAWVMTRDNPMQNIEEVDQEKKVLNEQSSNQQSPLPYAHNIDTSKNNNPLGINDSISSNLANPNNVEVPMSSTPPLGVQASDLDKSTQNTNNMPNKEHANFEDDARYVAAYKALQDKYEANKDTKSQQDKKEQEVTQPKVITPLEPKKVTIAQAPDPTIRNQAKSTDVKANTKPNTEAPKQAQKDSKPTLKDPKKEEQKQVVQVNKDKPKETVTKQPSPDKVIPRPQSVAGENQGKAPEKGHYIQVGSFTVQDKITPEFLNKVSKYSYRKENSEYNGKPSVKYLIGPYKTREEAKQVESKIRTEIKSDAFYVKR